MHNWLKCLVLSSNECGQMHGNKCHWVYILKKFGPKVVMVFVVVPQLWMYPYGP
jgi:hypothetical protein